MLAQRQVYEHAPRTISTPAEFHNASIEVLFFRLHESGTATNTTSENADSQMNKILMSEPVQLSAISLDTTSFTFCREEANAR